ncbi:hypothetical protein RUM43_004606 [Polyplax serrata]|uniref:Uncharacterized protein n=1 Tax=Polyplax serrata TaxID=468196 RepID=A0AAN8XLE5_POLSC
MSPYTLLRLESQRTWSTSEDENLAKRQFPEHPTSACAERGVSEKSSLDKIRTTACTPGCELFEPKASSFGNATLTRTSFKICDDELPIVHDTKYNIVRNQQGGQAFAGEGDAEESTESGGDRMLERKKPEFRNDVNPANIPGRDVSWGLTRDGLNTVQMTGKRRGKLGNHSFTTCDGIFGKLILDDVRIVQIRPNLNFIKYLRFHLTSYLSAGVVAVGKQEPETEIHSTGFGEITSVGRKRPKISPGSPTTFLKVSQNPQDYSPDIFKYLGKNKLYSNNFEGVLVQAKSQRIKCWPGTPSE